MRMMFFFRVKLRAVHFWENFPKKQWAKIWEKSQNVGDSLRTRFVRVTAAEREGGQGRVVASQKTRATFTSLAAAVSACPPDDEFLEAVQPQCSLSVVDCGLRIFGKIFPKSDGAKFGEKIPKCGGPFVTGLR
jgi:hypothetical protein